MREIIFAAEAPEGGYVARALGAAIFTEADTLEALREAVRDTVRCHFDEADRPKVIRLHLVRDKVVGSKDCFAFLSAPLQRGLTLVAREEEEHEARLAAIRADLERRAAQPWISTGEIERRLPAWRARRDTADTSDGVA